MGHGAVYGLARHMLCTTTSMSPTSSSRTTTAAIGGNLSTPKQSVYIMRKGSYLVHGGRFRKGRGVRGGEGRLLLLNDKISV